MHKVLLVDDDLDLLEMVTMVLTKQGYTVSTMTNGRDFFSMVDSFQPDLILLDIFLGDNDGRMLCQQLKETPAYKNIPIVLYSAGHISRDSIDNSKANAFVTKPFDIKQLADKIKGMLAA